MKSLTKVYISHFPRRTVRFVPCLMTHLRVSPVWYWTIGVRISNFPYFKEEINA
jgi:hypothetical protein